MSNPPDEPALAVPPSRLPSPGNDAATAVAASVVFWRLGFFFSVVYALQAVGEPTDGMIVQPLRSVLRAWGRSTSQISAFLAVLAIPWAIKPLYGLLSDFVPLAGSRRRSYLVITSAAASAAFLALALLPVRSWGASGLFCWLFVATLAVAFADVVADALMVEIGQPLGLTGRFQSLQWASLFAASIAGGWLGGWITDRQVPRLGFLVCGAVAALTLALALRVSEGPQAARPRPGTVRLLWQTARSPAIVGLSGILLLWNFNPCSTTIVHLHLTGPLGLSEPFYGHTVSLMALASLVASLSYATYCRRVPMRWLLHASIVLGIVSNLAYCGLSDARSAVVVTVVVGFTSMTALLVQLDLAARFTPPAVAGTTFALLMAFANLGLILATWLGGSWYERTLAAWGHRAAFQLMAVVGAIFTALCWLLVPLIPDPPVGKGERD